MSRGGRKGLSPPHAISDVTRYSRADWRGAEALQQREEGAGADAGPFRRSDLLLPAEKVNHKLMRDGPA